MKIFIDANVLVSVLNKEYPVFPLSSRILSLNDFRGYYLYTSPVCLAIAFYFSEKKSGYGLARKKIELLCKNMHITETGPDTVRKTLTNNKINDFEDGLEYYSAINSGCNCIVTEDKQDFYFSEIEIMNCEEFLNAYWN